MAASADTIASCPKQVLIQGAGTDEVNGVYFLVEIYNDAGLYRKTQGEEVMGFANVLLSLYRMRSFRSSEWHWYISDGVPEYAEFNFYYAKESSEEPGVLPLENWQVPDFGSGASPPPSCSIIPMPDAVSPVHGLPEATIAEQTVSAYEKMYLSEDFSDVKLGCEDETIPAHKNVLAASCSYFHAAFTGPWNENDSGELKVSHSSKVVKMVLKTFYTGVLDMEAVEEDPVPFIAIACEFDLPWLKQVAEKVLSKSINESNLKTLKDTWRTAHLYGCDTVKSRFVEFVKGDAVAVLLDGGMSTLQADDSSAWNAFVSEMEKEN